MMESRYVKELNREYLVVSVKEGETEPDYQMHMLAENQIAGLLPVQIRQIDCQIEYYYEITGMVPLEQYLARHAMGYQELKDLVTGLQGVWEQTMEFLLDMDRICLEPEWMFLDGNGFSFCYGGEGSKEFWEQFRELMQRLLVKLDHTDEKTVYAGYLLYQECQAASCSIEKCAGIFQKKAEWEALHQPDTETSVQESAERLWTGEQMGQQETTLLTDLPIEEAAWKAFSTQPAAGSYDNLSEKGRSGKGRFSSSGSGKGRFSESGSGKGRFSRSGSGKSRSYENESIGVCLRGKRFSLKWLAVGIVSGVLECIVCIGMLLPVVQEWVDPKLLAAVSLLLLMGIGVSVIQCQKEQKEPSVFSKRN